MFFLPFYLFTFLPLIANDDHKILGDGGDGIADAAFDF